MSDREKQLVECLALLAQDMIAVSASMRLIVTSMGYSDLASRLNAECLKVAQVAQCAAFVAHGEVVP